MQEIIGYIAAFCTTFAFLPQTVKILRERNTQGISLLAYVIFSTGLCLWLAYGVMLGSWPIILSNIFTLALSGTIVFLKLRYG